MLSKQEIIEAYFKNNAVSENTKLTYDTAFHQFLNFTDKDLKSITLEDVNIWLDYLNKKYKKTTRRAKISAVKSLFNYYAEEGIIKRIPFTNLDIPGIDSNIELEYLTKRELFLLIEKARLNLRDRCIFKVLFTTGVRVSELINIQLTDINIEDRKILIIGKGGHAREVIFSIRCREVVKLYLNTQRDDNIPYLFITRLNKPFTRQGIWNIVKKYAKLALPNRNVYPHMFRHGFGSNMSARGMDNDLLSRLMGHMDGNYTKIYIHSSTEENQKEFDKYN